MGWTQRPCALHGLPHGRGQSEERPMTSTHVRVPDCVITSRVFINFKKTQSKDISMRQTV